MDCKDMTKTDTSTGLHGYLFNRMPQFIVCFSRGSTFTVDPCVDRETDPYYCTVVISNLSSIKLHSGYHHLTKLGHVLGVLHHR